MSRPLAMSLAMLLASVLATECAARRHQQFESFKAPLPLPRTDTLIIGIMGGRVQWDHPNRGVSRLAARLRAMDLPGVHVETLENARRDLGVRLVKRAFDLNNDGRLGADERAHARVIVYGQSFGGSATLRLARELGDLGIPVLLAIRIDAVGRDKGLVPPNVRLAANLYQRDGTFLKGSSTLRVEDEACSTILVNRRFSYRDKRVPIDGVPWYRRLFQTTHFQMDFDPEVWQTAEAMILETLEARAEPESQCLRPIVEAAH